MYERVFADEVDDCESDAVEEEEGGVPGALRGDVAEAVPLEDRRVHRLPADRQGSEADSAQPTVWS